LRIEELLMINRFFWVAFALGLAATAWVGLGFVGTNGLALAMTAVIAAAYLAGAFELRLHRAQTAGLRAALGDATGENPGPATLPDLLDAVPPALRDAVRQRVEAGRGGLPGPAITPYLVGLLVMLGMLGTFLGMVVTFKGAVFALEGSTDMQAIRAALAEPIRGLGLSFGTSVAGVAASAMLGLMSAITRRERIEVSRLLDLRAATVLRPFTLAHRRDETLRAVQAQAAALPAIVERLDAMMERIERRSRDLDDRLLGSQQQFHRDATAAYSGLAKDVGASLRESLAAGAKAAGESIRPVIEDAMTGIVQDTQRLHAGLADTARAQVDAVSERFADVAGSLSENWQRTLQTHSKGETERLHAWTQQLQTMAAALEAQSQRATEQADAQATRTLAEVTRLVAQSEALVAARMDTESRWLDQHGERMDELTGVWRTQLETLRQEESLRGDAAVARLDDLQAAVALQLETLRHEESLRGDAAVARLDDLQAAVARHLATLGAALEAPLARLLATASEVPEAAAGVLAQLRAEMSRLAQQENASLQERTLLVERLGTLVQAVEDASRKAADMATQASANAVELSSWGDAFGQGVQMFHASNEKLVAAMQQVEGAVTRSTARSDDQLAYYVAQAREVIDLSIASQHGVIDRLRELAGKPVGLTGAGGVGAKG